MQGTRCAFSRSGWRQSVSRSLQWTCPRTHSVWNAVKYGYSLCPCPYAVESVGKHWRSCRPRDEAFCLSASCSVTPEWFPKECTDTITAVRWWPAGDCAPQRHWPAGEAAPKIQRPPPPPPGLPPPFHSLPPLAPAEELDLPEPVLAPPEAADLSEDLPEPLLAPPEDLPEAAYLPEDLPETADLPEDLPLPGTDAAETPPETVIIETITTEKGVQNARRWSRFGGLLCSFRSREAWRTMRGHTSRTSSSSAPTGYELFRRPCDMLRDATTPMSSSVLTSTTRSTFEPPSAPLSPRTPAQIYPSTPPGVFTSCSRLSPSRVPGRVARASSCFYFWTKRGCRNGTNCRFAHHH